MIGRQGEGEDRALIPISIGKKNFRGLVDTGASRSCISERTYNTLKLPEIKKLLCSKSYFSNWITYTCDGGCTMYCNYRKEWLLTPIYSV